ncbi:MAG: hypothetical protein ABI367_04645 [Mucilaginibacter sp.]
MKTNGKLQKDVIDKRYNSLLTLRDMQQLPLAIILVILLIGTTLRASAQIMLPEVSIVASTYKYLNAADNKEMAQPVRMLEFNAATYDIKKSEFYNEDYEGYYVSFYIPDGEILAEYNKNGKLLRTVEKFKNTTLPAEVKNTVSQVFPGWHISEDVYKVYYYDQKGKADKIFKLQLEDGSKRIKVKLNENGVFL